MRNFPTARAESGTDAAPLRPTLPPRADARSAKARDTASKGRAIRFTDWALI